MPIVKSNGIEIAYESFGDENNRPLLLITGLGTQRIRWPEPFCEKLARQGHRVIRLDNRDTGLSTRLASGGIPNITRIMEIAGMPSTVPRT